MKPELEVTSDEEEAMTALQKSLGVGLVHLTPELYIDLVRKERENVNLRRQVERLTAELRARG